MRSVNRRMLQPLIIAIFLSGFSLPTSGLTHAQSLKPIYWKEQLFYIPYQGQQREKFLKQVSKVQLMLSRDGMSDWQVLQEAKPEVQGFSYHVPGDGEYWFTLRHFDRLGRPTNGEQLVPQLRMIVDTKNPLLELEAALDLAGNVVIHYESSDLNLNHNSLVIEVSPDGKNWRKIKKENPDVSQPDKILGRTHWQPPFGSSSTSIRATIADYAGHQSKVVEQLDLNGPSLTGIPSNVSNPNSSTNFKDKKTSVMQNPFQVMQNDLAQNWPAHNQKNQQITQEKNTGDNFSKSNLPPPILNPYTTASSSTNNGRIPAKLLAGSNTLDVSAAGKLVLTPPNNSNSPQEKISLESKSNLAIEDWTATKPSSNTAIRSINSSTFDVEYDLESVGPWGLTKIELWGTHDSGNTWQLYSTDSDNRSPIRVTVPGSGQYGFLIQVHGANGAAAPTPRIGDKAELTVNVDLLPPNLEIIDAILGEGHFGNHLAIEWSATDSNLESRPITLSYSSHPNGPWTTIAARLENSGKYVWQIERHIPARFYLRIEGSDEAGNTGIFYYPNPIDLPRAQPTGTLRGIRPVQVSPEPLRAAFPVEKR